MQRVYGGAWWRLKFDGSFMSPKKRANINFHYFLNPLYRYHSIDFRIVCKTGAEFMSM